MKAFRLLILVIAIGVGLYFYLHKEENFKVKDSITVSQKSGMDITGPITAPPKFATIQGTITNISEKNFKDVEILYQTGYDTIRAYIGNLPSGESSDFETKRVRVRSGNPEYVMKDILFKEE
jgi:hypothetical protein